MENLPGSGPAQPPGSRQHPPRRRKNHRGGKKKKSRRKSFAVGADDMTQDEGSGTALNAARESFYDMPSGNLSGTSIDSEALLDHRYCPRVALLQHLIVKLANIDTSGTNLHSSDRGGRPL